MSEVFVHSENGFTRAIAQAIIKGPHGHFAIATVRGVNGIVGGRAIFSLFPPVWKERAFPESGTHVLLGDLFKKRSKGKKDGWRAGKARLVRPSDENTATNGKNRNRRWKA